MRSQLGWADVLSLCHSTTAHHPSCPRAVISISNHCPASTAYFCFNICSRGVRYMSGSVFLFSQSICVYVYLICVYLVCVSEVSDVGF